MICIFAKDPERAKRRLAPLLAEEGAAALAAAFLDDVRALVGAPHHLWADGAVPPPVHAQQVGADLGARMLHTLESELGAGARAVVIVGTDAPTLPRAMISEALAQLEAGGCDLALGPAADGGYYLIGATAAGVRADLFTDIPWSTERVCRVTLARALAARLRVHLLPWWYDVDTPSDLALLEAHLPLLPQAVAPATRSFLARWPGSRLK